VVGVGACTIDANETRAKLGHRRRAAMALATMILGVLCAQLVGFRTVRVRVDAPKHGSNHTRAMVFARIAFGIAQRVAHVARDGIRLAPLREQAPSTCSNDRWAELLQRVDGFHT
jgi:hypothetical protein